MKLTRFFSFAAIVLSVSGTAFGADWNDVISAANPVNWYAFEDNVGDTDISDIGSDDNDGTVIGSVGLGVAGVVGNAASFDGSSAVQISGPDITGDWTVEAIFSADTVNGGASMGLIGTDFTAADRMAIKADQWNKTGQLGYTVFGVVDETFTEAGAASPSSFTYVALVGTGTGVELFVNGASVSNGATATALSRFVVGAGAVRDDGSLVDGLTGVIDDLVIYNRALSAGDVAAHYAAIPEPASVTLSLIGLLGLLGFRRRR